MRHSRFILLLLATLLAGPAAMASPVMSEIARNPAHYTLRFDYDNFINGEWQGDARFALSACPQASCFHLAGAVSLPPGRSPALTWEAYFPVPRSSCVLHFEEVPRNGMDSGDYRITPVDRGRAKGGCASVPAGLGGIYVQLPSPPGLHRRT